MNFEIDDDNDLFPSTVTKRDIMRLNRAMYKNTHFYIMRQKRLLIRFNPDLFEKKLEELMFWQEQKDIVEEELQTINDNIESLLDETDTHPKNAIEE